MSVLSRLTKLIDLVTGIEAGGIENIESDLSDVLTDTTSIDANTAQSITLASAGNTSLVSIDRALNHSTPIQKQELLTWPSAGTGYLPAGDFVTTPEWANVQNTTAVDAIVKKVYVAYHGTATSWQRRRVFTSTAGSADSFINIGVGTTTNAITTLISNIENNIQIDAATVVDQGNVAGVSPHPSTICCFELQFPIPANSYLLIELSGTFTDAADNSFVAWADIEYRSTV